MSDYIRVEAAFSKKGKKGERGQGIDILKLPVLEYIKKFIEFRNLPNQYVLSYSNDSYQYYFKNDRGAKLTYSFRQFDASELKEEIKFLSEEEWARDKKQLGIKK